MRILLTLSMVPVLCLPLRAPFAQLAPTPGEALVSQVWAQPTVAGTTTARVNLRLGDKAEGTVIGASSPIADSVEVSAVRSKHGRRSNSHIAGSTMGADATASPPRHYHLTLVGLHAPLVAGQSFPLTLIFDQGPPVALSVTVRRHKHTPAS